MSSRVVAMSVAAIGLVGMGSFAGFAPVGPWFGSVAALAVDPSRPETVYALVSNGGIWRSDDGAGSWRLAGTDMTRHRVDWLVAGGPAAGTLYLGISTVGVYRSTDSGATFTKVNPRGIPGQNTGYRIAIAPSDPKRIFHPDTQILWESMDGGRSYKEVRLGSDVSSVAFDPRDPRNVYAGITHNGGLLKSTDGGKTFDRSAQGLDEKTRVSRLLVDPTNPLRVFASAYDNLFRSSDGGATWAPAPLGVGATADLYDMVVDADGILYVATEEGLLRSSDGGAGFQEVGSHAFGGYLAQALAVDPGSPGTVYAGGGTGVFKSTDGAATFTAANRGLSGAWIEEIAAAGGSLLVQTSAGLLRRAPGGTWDEVRRPFEDDGPATVPGLMADATAAATFHVAARSSYYRSTDGGSTWTEPAKKKDGQWIECVAQSPADANLLLAWARSGMMMQEKLLRSTDGGVKWKELGKGPGGATIRRLVFVGSDTVIAIDSSGAWKRSTDGGATFGAPCGWDAARKPTSLASDPSAPGRFFVATKEGLYRSTDGGATYTLASLGLGDEKAVEAVAVARSGRVFAGTFEGVLASDDHGVTWKPWVDGLTNLDVRALAVDLIDGRLYAGTAGGGVFAAAIE